MVKPHHSNDRGETTTGGHSRVFTASTALVNGLAMKSKIHTLIMNIKISHIEDINLCRQRDLSEYTEYSVSTLPYKTTLEVA
jgi:hypothetical protein